MGKLFVVGIGPGNEENMTLRARAALEQCPVIVGYKTYVELVKPVFKEQEKRFLDTGMRQEVERCKLALQTAMEEDTDVCMICSGDAGIYGMAGIILELATAYKDVSVEIIPGVTAALSGSAVLGAAVGHDVAIISLSDLLTPREVIEKRIRHAAEADFVIVLYNPASHKRKDYTQKACEIVMEYQSKDTICGFVKNIGRNEETMEIMTLEKLKDADVDMFTTVFIGNSQTIEINGRMVTPRGYQH